MATSSITKRYVVRDNKSCDVLIRILSEKESRRKKTTSKKYEEGKKLLAQL